MCVYLGCSHFFFFLHSSLDRIEWWVGFTPLPTGLRTGKLRYTTHFHGSLPPALRLLGRLLNTKDLYNCQPALLPWVQGSDRLWSHQFGWRVYLLFSVGCLWRLGKSQYHTPSSGVLGQTWTRGGQELWFCFLGSSFANHNQEAKFALKSAKAFQRLLKKGAWLRMSGWWKRRRLQSSVVCVGGGGWLAWVFVACSGVSSLEQRPIR